MKSRNLLAPLFLLCTITFTFAKTDDTDWCGTKGPMLTEYFVKQHEHRVQEGQVRAMSDESLRRQNQDIGNIAIMKTDGQNFIQVNLFDLQNKKISYTRNPAGGFNMKVVGAALGTIGGTAVSLTDDDSKQVNFTNGFSFPYNGTTYTSVFINSDGNLTFKEGDKDSADRSVLRALTGPPRICPFFQDMNVQNGGSIKIQQTSTKFVASWDRVPEFNNSSSSNTFQAILYKNGNIDLVFGSRVDTRDAVVGISPGNSPISQLKLVDYSKTPPLSKITQAIFERFAVRQEVDWDGLVGEFQQTHPPIYDFLVFWFDFPQSLGGNAFAFYSPIKNDVKGIGLPVFDLSRFFNTQKLQGFLAMGDLGNYPQSITQKFLGENNTLDIMGQENGHRWMAFVKSKVNGVNTEDLLGRASSHWSFNMDSDASVMEGNDLRDNANGTFTTVGAVTTYSKLDQYLMGFIPPGAVPPTFFVLPAADKGRPPQIGVNLTGTKTMVSVSQIVQANGPRLPASATSQKKFKEAWILLTKTGSPAPGSVERLDAIRVAWTAFFHKQTSNHGTLDTTLTPKE